MCTDLKYIFVCVQIHSCMFTYVLFKSRYAYFLCTDSLCQYVCVCVSVSCWWGFPGALCYSGELLHLSFFDSSAAHPGGSRHTQHSTAQQDRLRTHLCTCKCMLVSQPWPLNYVSCDTNANHLNANMVMHHWLWPEKNVTIHTILIKPFVFNNHLLLKHSSQVCTR